MAIMKGAALAGVFLAGSAVFGGRADAAQIGRACLVDSVAVIETRMHIKCAPAASGLGRDVTYYAMNLSEGATKVHGLIALAIESKRRNKAMHLWYDEADYASVKGCLGNNCRRLIGAAME